MSIESRGDVTILSGKIIDQSHLQSILDQLMNQGVELISVNPGAGPAANG